MPGVWPGTARKPYPATPPPFLRLFHDTHLAFSFRTRGRFVAIGFYYGCAWCLATRGLREWLGLLEAVPQTTDHLGYTLQNMPKHARLLAKAIHTSGGNHPIVPVRSASFQPQSHLGRQAHLSHRRGFTHVCHSSFVGSPAVVSTVIAWREGTKVKESVDGPPGGGGSGSKATP